VKVKNNNQPPGQKRLILARRKTKEKQKATINLCGSQAANGNLEDKQKKINK